MEEQEIRREADNIHIAIMRLERLRAVFIIDGKICHYPINGSRYLELMGSRDGKPSATCDRLVGVYGQRMDKKQFAEDVQTTLEALLKKTKGETDADGQAQGSGSLPEQA